MANSPINSKAHRWPRRARNSIGKGLVRRRRHVDEHRSPLEENFYSIYFDSLFIQHWVQPLSTSAASKRCFRDFIHS
ncbi:unnamed protein product [Caenorhabditis auriculariae]|uniref:Uncharacterized protein n=1 Tax=Caenorhabditis auriculariae TaxID=2777116 RepID=A0A8S1H4G0_9PELO|nr:unnamed protein product [Caenorhabditis auriculariae]